MDCVEDCIFNEWGCVENSEAIQIEEDIWRTDYFSFDEYETCNYELESCVISCED